MNILSSLNFIDYPVNASILAWRTGFWNNFFLAFTRLGDWKVILILTVLISILFWIYNKRNLILPLFVAILGSGIFALILKYLVDRVRPDPRLAVYIESGPSFPSAHAVLTAALFGFLIYIVWRFYSNLNLFTKIILTAVFSLVILIIGFSRLYLGVHFLTDVLAGYLIGFLGVLTGMYISKKNLLSKPQ